MNRNCASVRPLPRSSASASRLPSASCTSSTASSGEPSRAVRVSNWYSIPLDAANRQTSTSPGCWMRPLSTLGTEHVCAITSFGSTSSRSSKSSSSSRTSPHDDFASSNRQASSSPSTGSSRSMIASHGGSYISWCQSSSPGKPGSITPRSPSSLMATRSLMASSGVRTAVCPTPSRRSGAMSHHSAIHRLYASKHATL